jgi:hypothetical protein
VQYDTAFIVSRPWTHPNNRLAMTFADEVMHPALWTYYGQGHHRIRKLEILVRFALPDHPDAKDIVPAPNFPDYKVLMYIPRPPLFDPSSRKD